MTVLTHSGSEFAELQNAIQESSLTREDFLKKRFEPITKRLDAARGQMIASLNRYYESLASNYSFFGLEEMLQVGVIGQKTEICLVQNYLRGSLFENVERAHSYSREGWRPNSEVERSALYCHGNNVLELFFMERPPESPKSEESGGCFGGRHLRAFPTEKPRLELFIGDSEAIPFFQKRLKGYEYQMLSRALGKTLPLNPEIEKEISKEQIELYMKIIEKEREINTIRGVRDRRLGALAENGGKGVIVHSASIELCDEVTTKLQFNPQISDANRTLAGLYAEAKKRRYDIDGISTSVAIDAGVTYNYDFKKFFGDRIGKVNE